MKKSDVIKAQFIGTSDYNFTNGEMYYIIDSKIMKNPDMICITFSKADDFCPVCGKPTDSDRLGTYRVPYESINSFLANWKIIYTSKTIVYEATEGFVLNVEHLAPGYAYSGVGMRKGEMLSVNPTNPYQFSKGGKDGDGCQKGSRWWTEYPSGRTNYIEMFDNLVKDGKLKLAKYLQTD